MRMWNVDPSKLCMKHLSGEHRETHALVGMINKGIKLNGYINTGLIEVHNIKSRHIKLAFELLKREAIRDPGKGHYYHKSSLPEFIPYIAGKVDVISNIEELKRRCPECRKNLEKT